MDNKLKDLVAKMDELSRINHRLLYLERTRATDTAEYTNLRREYARLSGELDLEMG